MRSLAVVVVLATLAGAAWAAPVPVVPCSQSIGTTTFPYGGNSRPEYRYRTVLGTVSVPPAYMEQVVRVDKGPWKYWRKAGLVIRADGRSVTITVPPAWRTRASIEWGNGGGSPLRIAGCGSDSKTGNAYAGGFYLRSPACVPLVFRVGTQTETVRFGVGRRCGT